MAGTCALRQIVIPENFLFRDAWLFLPFSLGFGLLHVLVPDSPRVQTFYRNKVLLCSSAVPKLEGSGRSTWFH